VHEDVVSQSYGRYCEYRVTVKTQITVHRRSRTLYRASNILFIKGLELLFVSFDTNKYII